MQRWSGKRSCFRAGSSLWWALHRPHFTASTRFSTCSSGCRWASLHSWFPIFRRKARDFHWVAVVARLRTGVTREQAAAELSTLAQRFAMSYPATDKGNSFVFEQAGTLPPRERSAVLIFLSALSLVVILLLAIAAANVANLLFAQAAGRQGEMAVRLALGATRGRLRRQVLMESVMLGLGGGVLGAFLLLLATPSVS